LSRAAWAATTWLSRLFMASTRATRAGSQPRAS